MQNLKTRLLLNYLNNKEMFLNPLVNNLFISLFNCILIYVGLQKSKKYLIKYKNPQLAVLTIEFALGLQIIFWKTYYFRNYDFFISTVPNIFFIIFLCLILINEKFDYFNIRHYRNYKILRSSFSYVWELLILNFILIFLITYYFYQITAIACFSFLTFASGIGNYKNEKLSSTKLRFNKEKSAEGILFYNISGIIAAIALSFFLLKKVYISHIISASFISSIVYMFAPKFLEKIFIFLSILFLYKLI